MLGKVIKNVKTSDLKWEDVMVLMVMLNPKNLIIYETASGKKVSLDDMIDKDKLNSIASIQLASTITPENLIFPEGWYWNKKNVLTNKYNSSSGRYSTIQINKVRAF